MPTAEHTKLSAIKHRCRARRTARKRARPAFLCPRSDPCVHACVQIFFSFRYSVAGERAHDAGRATLRGYRQALQHVAGNIAMDGSNHLKTTASKNSFYIKRFYSFYKFIETFIYNCNATLIYSECKTVIV